MEVDDSPLEFPNDLYLLLMIENCIAFILPCIYVLRTIIRKKYCSEKFVQSSFDGNLTKRY